VRKTLVRAAIFTALFPGTVTVLVPALLLATFGSNHWLWPAGVRGTGIGLIVLGAGVSLSCAASFLFAGGGTPAPWFARKLRFLIGEEPRLLVTRALYGRVRNPMYLGVLLVLCGEAVWFVSPALFLYAAGAWLFMHLTTVYIEEPHLRRRDGEAYAAYCRSVPRWLPRLRGPSDRFAR
jgi:protein-S-isoprenylcysteine O-methyltransferase Ste14